MCEGIILYFPDILIMIETYHTIIMNLKNSIHSIVPIKLKATTLTNGKFQY